MATETDIRREIAGEREQLTDAVGTLRAELEVAAGRAKKVGAALGTVAGIAAVFRLARRFRRG